VKKNEGKPGERTASKRVLKKGQMIGKSEGRKSPSGPRETEISGGKLSGARGELTQENWKKKREKERGLAF